jgi:hypothetical protein
MAPPGCKVVEAIGETSKHQVSLTLSEISLSPGSHGTLRPQTCDPSAFTYGVLGV